MADRTVTVKSSGGDYASLNAALSGESADLVTNTRILTIECYAMADTTAANTGTGYTTSATYYIKITTPAAARHAGVWDTAKYYMSVADNYCLYNKEDYLQVFGLQFTHTASSDVANGGITHEPGATLSNLLTVGYCIFKGGTNTGDNTAGAYGIRLYEATSTYAKATIYNSLFYDYYLRSYSTTYVSYQGGVKTIYAHTVKLYNCTAVKCSAAFQTGGYESVAKAMNCLADQGGVSAFKCFVGAQWNDVDYCATSDATGDDYGGTGNHISHTFTFAGAADFHLASTDTGAIDLGDSNVDSLFTDDIDGVTRSGTWDIGADEYAAAGATPLTFTATDNLNA